MLFSLNLVLDRDIEFTEKFDRIIIVENVRDYILKMTDKEDESIKRIINHSEHSIPKVIYARPHKNKIKIYGIGEDGFKAIETIKELFEKNKSITIKNIKYQIRKISIVDNLQLLPYITETKNQYTTLTPLCIINKHNQRTYQWIVGKNFGDGKYIQHGTKEQLHNFYEDIKEFTSNQMRDHIKYVLGQLIKGKEKEDFSFVDNIKIEWDDLTIIHHHYHSEEKAIPMVVGRFSSNYVLPKFIGYKIGKGFGELNLKSTKVA